MSIQSNNPENYYKISNKELYTRMMQHCEIGPPVNYYIFVGFAKTGDTTFVTIKFLNNPSSRIEIPIPKYNHLTIPNLHQQYQQQTNKYIVNSYTGLHITTRCDNNNYEYKAFQCEIDKNIKGFGYLTSSTVPSNTINKIDREFINGYIYEVVCEYLDT